MKRLVLIFGTIVLFLSTSLATEATFTITMQANKTRMTWMNGLFVNNNYGSSSTSQVDDPDIDTRSSLLIQDSALCDSIRLRSLPYVKSASLILKFDGIPSLDWVNDGTMELWVVRVRRADWHETQATATIFKTSNNWSTSGAVNVTNDIDTTVIVHKTLAAPSDLDSNVTIDVTTLFQTMDGTDTSYQHAGIMLLAPLTTHTTWGGPMSFRTDDHATSGSKPRLTVTLSDVPQPKGGPKARRRRLLNMSYKERIDAYCITG